MLSYVEQMYKELKQQEKLLKREDIRNATKSNELMLRIISIMLMALHDQEKNEKKSKKPL